MYVTFDSEYKAPSVICVHNQERFDNGTLILARVVMCFVEHWLPIDGSRVCEQTAKATQPN